MEDEVSANKTSLSVSGGFVGGLLDYVLYVGYFGGRM